MASYATPYALCCMYCVLGVFSLRSEHFSIRSCVSTPLVTFVTALPCCSHFTVLTFAISLCLSPTIRLFQNLVNLMIKVCRGLDGQEIRIGKEVDSRFDFRHEQYIFMQVLLSVLEALVDASYGIESHTSLADSNFVSTIPNDTAYILAVLQQQLAKQIGVLVDEQSLRVCYV